jgi:hypothetical protein
MSAHGNPLNPQPSLTKSEVSESGAMHHPSPNTKAVTSPTPCLAENAQSTPEENAIPKNPRAKKKTGTLVPRDLAGRVSRKTRKSDKASKDEIMPAYIHHSPNNKNRR